MELSLSTLVWITLIMLLTGFLVMKLAGRKSLSKMTISQAVIMIAVGSLMVEPIKEYTDGVINVTVFSLFMFILILYLLEFLALKNKSFEQFWIGSPKILIEDGNINYETMKKIRISETQLQMLLREKGIGNIADIKTLTIEPNGNIGYEKVEDTKAMTIGEFKRLTGDFFRGYESKETDKEKSPNLFEEVRKNDKQKN